MNVAESGLFSDIEIERKALKSILLKDEEKSLKNLTELYANGLDTNFFTGEFRKTLAKIIIDHFDKFGTQISKDIAWLKLKRRFKGNKDKLLENKTLFEKILKVKYSDSDNSFVYSELKKFALLRFITDINNDNFITLKNIKEGRESIEPEDLIQKIIQDFNNVSQIGSDNRIREGNIFDDESILDELDHKRKNPEESKGIDTGLEILTQVTSGWHPGQLIIVSGRPGQGKSILLNNNFGYSAYLNKKNVLCFSLEMPYRQQQMRMFARAMDLPYIKLKSPEYLKEDEWELIVREVKRHKKEEKGTFFVVDAPESCTINFIEQKITSFENTFKTRVDLVIVDPIYLMRPSLSTSDKREKDDPVGMLSGELKILAMKKGIPILGASQINREGGKRHQTGRDPSAMDLAFSDRLAHNADMIFIVTSDFNDLAQLHIVKFRDGAGPKIYLKKKFERMHFAYDASLNDPKELDKYIQHMKPKSI